MNIQGQVEGKEIKKAKTGQTYSCFLVNGKKFNSWDDKVNADINIGDLVELETETTTTNKGTFENLKVIRKIGKIEVQKINGNTASVKSSADFHLSIEEQRARALTSALKHAEICGLKADTEQILAIAALYLNFIKGEVFKANGNTPNTERKD